MPHRTLIPAASLALALGLAPGVGAQTDPFAALVEGEQRQGFRAEALYLDAAGSPLGARFVHGKTGFTLDLLRVQSVPQAFIWVTTLPVSDRGEAHTQEHLLLGKGNRGRAVANLETMSLATSSAFVQQWRTHYHFQTAGGPALFYRLLERQLDALLHPDYTDEEVRREVHHFGATVDPDGSLRLEEKGTVYNEMASSYERPFGLPYRALLQALYGEDHPLARSTGGLPAAIREMRPEHIRDFHDEHYRPGNMGMVAALPREMEVDAVLAEVDGILTRVRGDRPTRRGAETPLPGYAPAAEGTILHVEYPHQNEAQPSPLLLAFHAERHPEPVDLLLLELFVSAFSGDATTDLYRIFVDGRTREIETGAGGVWGSVAEDPGHAVFLGLASVTPALATEARIAEVQDRIVEELRRIAALPAGSPELAELNRRVLGRAVERRRTLSAFVDAPPGFGQRATGSGWIQHLERLAGIPGFRKELTQESELAAVEEVLAAPGNPWTERLERWKLTRSRPVAVMAVPSPGLIAREAAERSARSDAELRRIAAEHGTDDAQEALRRFDAAYQAETARLDALAAEVETPRFVDDPPLTLDDRLDYAVRELPGGVTLVASTFENMRSATAGFVLRLDPATPEERVYLAVLPALLTQTGVVRDGVPLPFGEMREALRREVLRLNAGISSNPATGRVELVVRGAGNDLDETRRALAWMHDVLYAPDWRPENLPRIRDVVDQSLASLRATTQGSEESWVHDPAAAYLRQDDALFLAAASFMTRAHNAHRLRWMLKEAPTGPGGAALDAFLLRLAAAEGGRAERGALAGALAADAVEGSGALLDAFRALPEDARAVAREVGRDLAANLPELPDGALAEDWRYLVLQMRADLAVLPARTLADLDALRRRLLSHGNARAFAIGSSASHAGMEPGLAALASRLDPTPAPRSPREGTPTVHARLTGRDPSAGSPRFVGLVHANTQSGVFLNSAPLAGFGDTDRESVLRFLAGRVYGGGGAHSIFMKTWGAGLAYSNGLRATPAAGRLNYYAERVPELPQTLRFVIDELRGARPDPALTEYAVAQAFGDLRGGFAYETRGESMAADLADGVTPERVAAFRRAVLAVREEPGLTEEVHRRMEATYGRVLPGYGPPSAAVEGAVFLVIGPERQLALYEEYLRGAEGEGTRVHRLHPRDFWSPAPVESGDDD